MAPAKSGQEIVIECSTATIVIAGKNLRAGAHAIANRLCGTIEAYDQARHELPGDSIAPFVETIRFFDPPSRKTQDDDEEPPKRAAKPVMVKGS
jgi:hypothetical protein